MKAYRGPPKNWKEVKFLGRGGTGDVWLCQDTDANNYQLVCKKIVADGVRMLSVQSRTLLP